jgi:hypothetical protein
LPIPGRKAYDKRLDASTLEGTGFEGIVTVDPTMIAERPSVFVYIKIKDFSISENGYLVPERPALEVEFWRHGQKITTGEAMPMVQESLKAYQ